MGAPVGAALGKRKANPRPTLKKRLPPALYPKPIRNPGSRPRFVKPSFIPNFVDITIMILYSICSGGEKRCVLTSMLHRQPCRNSLAAFPLPSRFVGTLLQLSVFCRTHRTLLLLIPFPINTSASVLQYSWGEGGGCCLATRHSSLATAFSKEL